MDNLTTEEIERLKNDVKQKEKRLEKAQSELDIAKQKLAEAMCPFKVGDFVIYIGRNYDKVSKVVGIHALDYPPFYGMTIRSTNRDGKLSETIEYVNRVYKDARLYTDKEMEI